VFIDKGTRTDNLLHLLDLGKECVFVHWAKMACGLFKWHFIYF